MLSLDDALARWLGDVSVLSAERVALADAADRVLAIDIASDRDLPPFDHSAMDGYAVATGRLAGLGPWRVPVSQASQAGAEPRQHDDATACRIFTGAPVPAGADAVVMQEDVTKEGECVVLSARPKVGQHIRRAGEDLRRGARALRAGARLRPGALALAAMIGKAEVTVSRRPHVTLLCTGDELVAPGERGGASSIPESNSLPLAALARQAGAAVRVAPLVRDDEAATTAAVRDALEGADVLVTVGGVSVGDHDHVRPALERAGVSLDFWKVAIKPGKPIAVGRRGPARVIGLPGNPASALVTFALFGAPLLRALQGDARALSLFLPARAAAGRKRSPDRVEFVRATLSLSEGILIATAHGNQASGAATSLAESDGLMVVRPGPTPLEAGAPVEFLRWSDA